MRLSWDKHWLLADREHDGEIRRRLREAGLDEGTDFLVRDPGWNSLSGKRHTNHRLMAYLFTGDGSGAVLAKMILE
jgi:hypothetical protein